MTHIPPRPPERPPEVRDSPSRFEAHPQETIIRDAQNRTITYVRNVLTGVYEPVEEQLEKDFGEGLGFDDEEQD